MTDTTERTWTEIKNEQIPLDGVRSVELENAKNVTYRERPMPAKIQMGEAPVMRELMIGSADKLTIELEDGQ